jgi:hypothetical protein
MQDFGFEFRISVSRFIRWIINMRPKFNLGRGKTPTDADRSAPGGVQELLPRRRRQRFALVVLARKGLSSAPEFPSAIISPVRAAFDSPFRASRTAKAPARVCLRPVLLLFMGMRFCFINRSG